MRMRWPIALGLLIVAALGVTAGYAFKGGGGEIATQAAACPKAWAPGWQRLANRIKAPVYCPTWLPDPLTGQIGGPWGDINSVDARDRSYLVGFLEQDKGEEIHVNLRGYPGRTAIPTCIDTYTVDGKTRRSREPCFSVPQGTRRIGDVDATVYTVNRGADEWHILYAWRRGHSLYTLSEHVAPPFGVTQVKQNLDRMAKSLVLIEPRA